MSNRHNTIGKNVVDFFFLCHRDYRKKDIDDEYSSKMFNNKDLDEDVHSKRYKRFDEKLLNFLVKIKFGVLLYQIIQRLYIGV